MLRLSFELAHYTLTGGGGGGSIEEKETKYAWVQCYVCMHNLEKGSNDSVQIVIWFDTLGGGGGGQYTHTKMKWALWICGVNDQNRSQIKNVTGKINVTKYLKQQKWLFCAKWIVHKVLQIVYVNCFLFFCVSEWCFIFKVSSVGKGKTTTSKSSWLYREKSFAEYY